MNSKILVQHRNGCVASAHVAEGFWSTPWAYLDKAEWRTRSGAKSKHGYHRWWRARCNDPDCPAEVLIREDAILEDIAVFA